MLAFWVTLVALAMLPFIWWPLRSARSDSGDQHTTRLDTLRSLYDARLRELEQERAEGLLDAASYAQALAELDRRALGELRDEAGRSGGTAARANPRILAVALGGLLPAGLVLTYLLLGEPAAPILADADTVLALNEDDSDELARWHQRLSERVAERPEDAKSHYLLGHVRLRQQRFRAAAEAFEAANAAQGKPDSGIDLYLLQARFIAAEGRFDESSRTIAARLLERFPQHTAVLEMQAIDALRGGRYEAAIGSLNQLLGQRLERAQRAALEAGLTQARAAAVAGSAGPALDVAITLDGEAPRGAMLFVIARPVGGGMPFAVVRRPGPDYPESVRLDDLVSMNPARPLSAAKAVEVVVRLSLSGRPQKQAGDWEWRSQSIALAGATEPVSLAARLEQPEQGSL